MYLQKLELQGFKSFAKRTILEFPELSKGHKGITSIVGPNGSGKSNIADAIRWVLGEQSLKTLRSRKSEDIIFFGSEKKGRLSMAEVSLYLNNEDKRVPVEYSEIVITRRLYRDGTSEYMLNKNTVRLQDVILLLAKSHFGQKSYSVVGQGMIDSILNASIGERKNFFYEATGVKQFQIKKDQAQMKLARTRENLQQTELTLHELEPHLRSLTRQVKRLEQREAVEKELRELQVRYFRGRWADIEKRLAYYGTLYKEKEGEKEGREKELHMLENELCTLEEGETRSEVFNELAKQHQKLINEKNTLSRELASVKGKLDVEYQKVGKMNVVWMGKRLDEIDARMTESSQQRELAEEKLSSNIRMVNEKQKLLEQVENSIRNFQIKIHEIQERVREYAEFSEEELNTEIEVVYHAQKNLILSIGNVRELSDVSRIEHEAKEIMKRLESLYEKVQKSSKDIQSREMILWQEELNKFLQEKNVLFGELTPLQSQRGMIEESLTVLEHEKGKLMAERDALRVEMQAASSDTKKDADKMLEQCTLQKHEIEKRLTALDEHIGEVRARINDFNSEEERKRLKLISLQKNVSAKQHEIVLFVNDLNEINIELTKLRVHREELEHSVVAELGDISLIRSGDSEATANAQEIAALEPHIEKLKHKLQLIGGIDEEAVREYKEVKERHDFLHEQYQDLVSAIGSLEKIIIELDVKITKQFNEQFKKIGSEFTKYFTVLFGGGSASLVRVMEEVFESEGGEKVGQANIENGGDEVRVEDEKLVRDQETKKKQKVFAGIDITASPPGKKVKHIASLSGGEKALTSIALICSIVANNPSPFVVLDEVDAALDESNSEKFADIVEQLSHKTQFIVITHNRSTMKRSHVLYGVTAADQGISRLLSIKLEDAEKIAKR